MPTLRATSTRIALLSLALQLAPVAVAGAQAGVLPPIRQLGAPMAVSHDTIGRPYGNVRPLADGRVMINDIGKRRVVILDSTLSHPVVIADSTATTNKAYGGQSGAIIAYRADTTIFVDPRAVALLVIDPHGTIVRTVSPPRPSDVGSLALSSANPGFDAVGRLVYRDVSARCTASGACGVGRPASQPAPVDQAPSTLPGWALHDSTAILRGNLTTHVIDTIGFASTPIAPHPVGPASPDGWQTMAMGNPFPFYDDFVVVSDGSVAFLRAQDYRIDWINADGSRTSTPKIAHDWHRMSDSEKARTVDSLRVFEDSVTKIVRARSAHNDSIARLHGDPGGNDPKVLWQVPDVSDLPDYTPPVGPQALMADADDNLWIRVGSRRPTSFATPPQVYDVVDRRGQLVDRVEIPSSLTVAGFGHGVIYLTSREAWGTSIAKYRIR